MITIDTALDHSMQLDFNSRELLIEILQKRQIEERRDQLAVNAKKAKQDFAKGKLQIKDAKDTIAYLQNLL
jgi:hypothetical protein